ncbi:MAG: HDOD domain-containing protein [Nitrospira sp.]|nr:HDOD domain-containing protein [Nitrospira sp.]MDH4369696.1 HDOD domain-containing protein [Nitrospira sp.]MDH5347490.1 HDOD domain-containing protein [Nitrospira sp.]MDH5497464.1 HDOD domain-containing protein [Nitrospira sp.]MDH5724652.1 HDOD domain-containing protein [Nitrospira sp.]
MTTFNPTDLRNRIEKLGDLPTLPHVVQRLAAMIGRPTVSTEEIGSIIEKDQVLAAKVLRLANSPFYGFPSRIGSVTHAVIVLGFNVVKGLTLCASALSIMKDAGMDQLWRHSLGVAITANLLATRLEIKNPEELFVAGLLHDIGKVVLYVKWPEVGTSIKDALQAGGDRSLFDVEQDVTGLSHADIGGSLANAWHLPITLREPISYHHNPALAKDAMLPTAIIHVADILVKGLACGNPGDDIIPPLSKTAWDMVGLDEQSLNECIEKVSSEFVTIDDYL